MLVKFAMKKSTQNQDIEVLELSKRSSNGLKRAGIKTIGEIINKWNEIPRLRGMGTTSVKEISNKILDLAISEMNDKQLDDFKVELIKNNSGSEVKTIIENMLK